MDKKIIVFFGILLIFVENLSAYSLEILNSDVVYFYESTKSIPMFLIIIGVIGLIYLIVSFFMLEHLITAIFSLGIVFILYTVYLYEEESRHIFDINKKAYYRLVSDDKEVKNYIKFQDINEIGFVKNRHCNPKGGGCYFVYGLYLTLKNQIRYELYSSRKNQDVIKMQGKLIAEYIEKPYK